MKNSNIVIVLIVLIILAILCIFGLRRAGKNNPEPVQTSSITGCYVSRTGQDIYTLNIKEQNTSIVSGTLSFQNYQKDSSQGTFSGTYENGILLGDYAFRSEGMDSVMQVIFKRSSDGFIRGYGEVNGDGTSFTDINNITFDASSSLNIFKKEPCP